MIEIEDVDSKAGILGPDTTVYEYDPRNLKIMTTYPGHNAMASPGDDDYEIVEYSYDGAHRSRVNTDQNGDTVTYVFDMADRLEQRKYRLSGAMSDESVDTFTYDAVSRTLTAEKGRYSNTVTFVYDDASRLTSESLAVNFGTARTCTVRHDYDDDNRRTETTYPNGEVVDRTFTDRDQLDQVDYDSSMVVDIVYDSGRRAPRMVRSNSYIGHIGR